MKKYEKKSIYMHMHADDCKRFCGHNNGTNTKDR
jgi:hypothetical protein